ncbi:right-handed parallel beta-helix repeat-containing protein [Spirosoma taeanense]|uniref:Right-handed parallel beta-helix repeat-containing protein n=1 Tax=Spirosoma taeanense TaxID=2735870 RepID=A0A6M5Y8B2_9BACT|nr:right-handed parallel beta-helix repeat-containing protein [Spirosoma taeanense]QJW90139.1 right-handed parallel beta-helix repeat-containing protein [Spirosoma taeanense]
MMQTRKYLLIGSLLLSVIVIIANRLNAAVKKRQPLGRESAWTSVPDHVKRSASTFTPKRIITSGGQYDGTRMGVGPGDTVGIQGTLPNLILKDFTGAPGKPIVFINYGDKAVIQGTTRNNGNFTISGCSYILVTGSGVAGIRHGFEVSSTFKDVSALVVAGKSTNIEIERVEVSQSGFAGMMIKTDPNKNDESTWLNKFVMQDVHVHHNYVHDTRGEGLYIGNSFWNKGRNGMYPHEIRGLHVHHNVIENAGCEGIQYSCSPGARVHHNRISKTGVSPFSNSQNAGVQISGGSSGDFYQNTIDSAQGIGLIIVGALRGGDSLRISNVSVRHSNLFAGTGSLPAETCGVFVDERETPPGIPGGGTLLFTNVTVDGARLDGFRFYNETQQNVVSRCVVKNFTRSAFDRSPKTVPLLVDRRTITGAGVVAKGIGYQK